MERKIIKLISIVTLFILLFTLIFSTSCRKDAAEEVTGQVTSLEEDAGLNIGKIITGDRIEIYIPPEVQGAQPEIIIEKVKESLPPPPENSSSVGGAYEITSENELSDSVLVILSYDPDDLSPNAKEENLYIATLVDDGWEVVEGGLIDTVNNTISVSVEHFSILGIFESVVEAAYDVVESVQSYTEKIARESFDKLPQEIKDDLVDVVTQDVKAVVSLEISHITKLASAIISFANLVSETSNLTLGALAGTKEAIAKAVILTTASLTAKYTQSELGSFGLMLYGTFETGRNTGKYLGGADLDPYTVAADAAAWLLQLEMEYINENIDKAFTEIYKYNPASFSKLSMYAVFIDSRPVPETGKPGRKGIKFYYFNESSGKWVNYYNDIATWEVRTESEKDEEVTETEEFVIDVPTTITITPNSSPTLEEAIEALVAGSTIVLEEGAYHISEPVIIDKSLNILGAGKDQTEIVSDDTDAYLIFKNGGPFIVEDITFRHTQGIYYESVIVESSNVTIENCSFKDSGEALTLKGNTTGLVKNCEFIHTGYGISITDNSTPKIESNDFRENHDAIRVEGNADVLIEYNACSNGYDGYGGIQFMEDSRGIARYNKCTDNDNMDGIYVGDYAVVTLEENECYSNYSNGIQVGDNAVATLTNNKCNNNGSSGIVFEGNSSGEASYNECIENEASGIYITESASVTLEYNKCMYNEWEGINYCSGGTGNINYNECVGNLYGLVIGSEAGTVYLIDNTCQGNKYDFEDYR